jgi:hypothetical protein
MPLPPKGQVTLGAVIEIILVISVFGIAVMFFPILKRQNEGTNPLAASACTRDCSVLKGVT